MFRPREPDLQSIDFVTRREQSGVSPIWLVPLAALLVGAWLAWTSWQARGPEVTITFPAPATEGLRVGATPLLYRSVEVGEVRSLRLTPDLDGVVVTASVAEELAPALSEGTRFQLVQRSPGEPAVIVVEPGPKGPAGRSFAGSVAPPVAAPVIEPVPAEPARAVPAPAPVDAPTQPVVATPEPAAGPPPGTPIVLTAAELGGLEPGTPIRLRGVPVGRIGTATLTPDGTAVRIEASVDQPFDALLREGVRLRRDGAGVVLEPAADPVAPPLSPGAELALVEPAPAPEPPAAVATAPTPEPAEAVPGAEPSAAAALAPRLRAVVLQAEPLRGLQVGSPVTLQGVPIGEVEALDLAWDAAAARLLTPITVALDPTRLRDAAGQPTADASQLLATLIERGLRVVRPAAEDLTRPGVALELRPQQPAVTPGSRNGLAVLPWATEAPPVPEPRPEPADRAPEPAAAVAAPESLAVVAADPALRETLAQLTATLAATEAALAGPDTQETLVAVRRAMGQVEQAGTTVRAELGPALGAIRGAAERLDAVLRDIVRKDSVTRVQINDTLKELASAARSVRIFADDLQRHPEALLRGKGGAYR